MPKKSTPTGSRRRISAADRDQILALYNEGVTSAEIARQLDIHGHVVNGVIRTATKRGALGPTPPSSPPRKETPPMPDRQTPPQTERQSVPPSSGSADGFSGGRPVVGGSGGFSNTSTAVKYTVERTVPPDGLLGTHYGSFSVDELGRIYGSGTYKVTKHEPGRSVPTEYVQTVAQSFGEPKFPNAAGERNRSRGYRPWHSRGNDRDTDQHEDEERPRPRPYWYGYYQRDRSQEENTPRESRLYDFARHASSASEGAMAKMVDQMDRMHQRSMEELKDARKGGPDTFVRDFFEKQQQTMNSRFEEERKLAEDRRKQDEDKWERRQKEDREAWQRRQDEEDKKHQREVERMKTEAATRLQEKEKEEERRQKREAEERKFLLDLEEKRLKIVQEEAKSQRERLETELKKTSATLDRVQEKVAQEIKDAREGAAEVIAESTQKLEERHKEREEQLEREHKLKEKHLDNEYKLQGQILDIKKESLESSGGDQLFTTINTVIKEFSKGLEKIVDLKKIEAMTPEAQAAAVAKGSIDGNVLGDPPKTQADAQRAAAQAQRQAEAQGAQRPTGNGGSHQVPPEQVAPAAEPENGETKMDSIIQQNLKNPIFREVIKEWALHVQTGSDATTFANLYLEMMRDPQNDEGRKACAAFATYMKPRNWEMMFNALAPHLDADIVKTFQLPQAEEFYEAFRAMVVEQIRDYWEQFIAARKAQQQAAAPAPQAPPAEPAEDPGVPVPTRESLRAQVEDTQ